MAFELALATRSLPLSSPFRISGYVFAAEPALHVTLRDGAHRGRGEAIGVYYLDDEPEGMRVILEAHRAHIESGIDRQALQRLLPPGGARHALDSALWELESQRTGIPVWKLAGLSPPRALTTVFTLGADDPAVMAQGALGYAQARALKLKLTGELDLDIARIRAVRRARPDVWIGVDANQGYVSVDLERLLPVLVEMDVSLLEQPCRRGHEAELDGIDHVVPIAADESVLHLAEMDRLPGRFDMVNIKLDKCGGLTEGLRMAERARALGIKVMVGSMGGTSLGMAPAFVLGQQCDVVDLDGPAMLAPGVDCVPGVRYEHGLITCADDVWGPQPGKIA